MSAIALAVAAVAFDGVTHSVSDGSVAVKSGAIVGADAAGSLVGFVGGAAMAVEAGVAASLAAHDAVTL